MGFSFVFAVCCPGRFEVACSVCFVVVFFVHMFSRCNGVYLWVFVVFQEEVVVLERYNNAFLNLPHVLLLFVVARNLRRMVRGFFCLVWFCVFENLLLLVCLYNYTQRDDFIGLEIAI